MSIVNKVGLNVEIKNKKNNKGKISFEYKDLDQLNKIINIIKLNYQALVKASSKIKSVTRLIELLIFFFTNNSNSLNL